jgi:hypothetical protein
MAPMLDIAGGLLIFCFVLAALASGPVLVAYGLNQPARAEGGFPIVLGLICTAVSLAFVFWLLFVRTGLVSLH